MLSRIYRPL